MRERVSPALRYKRSIRNPVKRFYAFDVHAALIAGQPVPEAPAGLSYMAAQAVRMRLREILAAS
jgi:hypothetical protein